ncbi:Rv0361 family membrane protein [Mycobacterium sp. MS1601]|jgi:hypothetical protein|uniref:Rv0361 family membrane protein n=1 Tax=Mycobacterium sp. MS1601 TaxID=1936029 RepID=UPI0009F9232B|nr:hypothetical protein [Mycobacterium sp. MS1601]
MTRLSRFAGIGVAAVMVAVIAGCSSDDGSSAEQSTTAATAATAPAAPTTTSTEAPPPPPPPSDEQQIRDTLSAFQDAYNSENWAAYQALMCPSMRERFTGSIMDSVRQTRASAGLTTMAVKAVTITGDTAVVTAENTNELTGTATVDLPLTRGDDGWAVCMAY